MTLLATGLWFFFGAIIGSFLNVVIWRLPREESLLGRSMCPGCGHVLSAWELFPIFSFVFLKGKCRQCRKKISLRYPLIEIITGLLFAFSWLAMRPETGLGYLLLAKSLLIVSVFVAVFVIDFEHYLIFDSIIFPAAAAVLLINFIADFAGHTFVLGGSGHVYGGLLGMVAAVLPFFLIWLVSRGKWMGFGDVKLAIFLGLALGWPLVGVNLMAAVLLGGAVSLILLASRRKTLKSQLPFGTFLSVAGVIAMFYGEQILKWYLALLGF